MTVLVEEDSVLHLLEPALDPDCPKDRIAAFADFLAHDVPDFDGWLKALQNRLPRLYGASVRFVADQHDFERHLGEADAVVLETLRLGKEQIQQATRLKVAQKFGQLTNNFDADTLADNGIRLLTLRRRINRACAEHVFALMLALARRLTSGANCVDEQRYIGKRMPRRPFDTRHTPGSNWPRISGLKSLFGARMGIVGFGEIGREIARLGAAFEMEVAYHQRNRLDSAEESALGVTFMPLDDLLARCDWIIPQLPKSESTEKLLGADEIARMKTGAGIVNVGWSEVVDHAAARDALQSGNLGGYGLDPVLENSRDITLTLHAREFAIVTPRIAGQPRLNILDDLEELVLGLQAAIAA